MIENEIEQFPKRPIRISGAGAWSQPIKIILGIAALIGMARIIELLEQIAKNTTP